MIKAKSSKHLLEVKELRTQLESNVIRLILKPQEMITEESKEVLEEDSSLASGSLCKEDLAFLCRNNYSRPYRSQEN